MDNIFNDDDRLYLQMMQENITRMSNNSANCKTWLVTIVTAMLAIGCNIQELHWWLLLTIAPILMFWYLDTFYLHLERGMRNRQRDFLNKAIGLYALADNADETEKEKLMKDYQKVLFEFKPKMNETDNRSIGFVSTIDRKFSKSILPIYGTLLIIVCLITAIINWTTIKSFLLALVQS